jgi:hypothetical protein
MARAKPVAMLAPWSEAGSCPYRLAHMPRPYSTARITTAAKLLARNPLTLVAARAPARSALIA